MFACLFFLFVCLLAKLMSLAEYTQRNNRVWVDYMRGEDVQERRRESARRWRELEEERKREVEREREKERGRQEESDSVSVCLFSSCGRDTSKNPFLRMSWARILVWLKGIYGVPRDNRY